MLLVAASEMCYQVVSVPESSCAVLMPDFPLGDIKK
ncbi:hypothetical protein YPC_0949 [Yersinia pestis biovar Medievalis str. Harbin 35]|nr:hypothetical protein YPC_0949 [Yersinia pestis biovar Medievalis str. Harbin 35]EEO75549.1 hypothetical protein YP516_3474 [Yersinia pestis Nepal516]EEO91244.1 hypothetical protein YPS_1468 [Yersinia pestis Pestoides A]